MSDTICAISTSLGIGAISIIRVSGNKAIEYVNSIFSSDLLNKESHTISYGNIIFKNEVIDEVLVMLMRSPRTYTTEDVVEINCHGGYNTTNKILEILLEIGCRLAEPGEFTKRAFLNGRINLLQSEAVMDLISSKTDSKRKMALNGIGGNLTKKIENIRESLLKLMANIEVNIDYPEYTDNFVITKGLLYKKLNQVLSELKNMLEKSSYGKIVNEGINIAIIGKPNVGKSSILNNLLDEKKAIVTDIAGTTRDTIEGTLSINGIEVKLIDTAGIHDTEDTVEKIGVERSIDAMNNADLVLLVLDGSQPMDTEDKKLFDSINLDKTIIFINKNDLKNEINISFGNAIYGNTLSIEGLDNLKNEIINKFNINEINKDLTYLSNTRQIYLIKKAIKSLENALESLNNKIPIDMVEIDLKNCFDFLGEILGQTYDDDIINRLFQDFCVGK